MQINETSERRLINYSGHIVVFSRLPLHLKREKLHLFQKIYLLSYSSVKRIFNYACEDFYVAWNVYQMFTSKRGHLEFLFLNIKMWFGNILNSHQALQMSQNLSLKRAVRWEIAHFFSSIYLNISGKLEKKKFSCKNVKFLVLNEPRILTSSASVLMESPVVLFIRKIVFEFLSQMIFTSLSNCAITRAKSFMWRELSTLS